jgi:hypothetical protein
MANNLAQAATEFLVIFAVTMVIVSAMIVLNYGLLSNTGERFKATKIQDALNDVARAAQLVYQEGNGAMTKVYIHIPVSIEATGVVNQTISISVMVSGLNVTFYRALGFNVSGTIPVQEGYYWINLTSRGTYVQVN